jgi:hypothetical protein
MMSSEGSKQHELEFGGSHIGADFDGTISFRLHDGIPVITVSHTFDDTTARQFRYLMGSTINPEYHFHQRHQYLVVDLRAVTGWAGGGASFLGEMQSALKALNGDLYLVTYDTAPLPGSFNVSETIEEALDKVRTDREAKRAAARAAR